MGKFVAKSFDHYYNLCTLDKELYSILPKEGIPLDSYGSSNYAIFTCIEHSFTKEVKLGKLEGNRNPCPECKSLKLKLANTKTSLTSFLQKAKSYPYYDEIDYSKVVYVDSQTEVILGCKNHDETLWFSLKPIYHVRTVKPLGCSECGNKREALRTLKKRSDTFKTKALLKNPLNSYELFNYVNNSTKGEIICQCGYHYFQTPADHLEVKSNGCPNCPAFLTLTTQEFIERSERVHGKGVFDYSETNYQTSRELVTIKCRNNHTFQQLPFSHLNGHGCRFCSFESELTGFSLTDRIEYSNRLYGGKDNLYVIKLWNNSETFYKIGISFNTYNRFQFIKHESGYNLEALCIIKSDCKIIWKLESTLHKLFREIKYNPAVKFAGSKLECFSNIDGILDHIPFDQVEVITDLLSQQEIAA